MSTTQETNVSLAFSKQAPHFDADDLSNPILTWMRQEVRKSVLKTLDPGNSILELNCGTGMDAVFFAEHNFKVLATDNAPGMLNELDKKISEKKLSYKIESKLCSFNNLQNLAPQKFDCVFSNFGGLNCSENLYAVVKEIDTLIKPGGIVTLVIMPPICPWEIAWIFKGNFKKALRRFTKEGVESHLEGVHFKTWYYSPAYLKKAFGKNYDVVELKAIGTIVPPPHMHLSIGKYARLLNVFKNLENRLNAKWPFYNLADHFLITVRKVK